MKNVWRKLMLFAVVLLGVTVFPAGVQAKKVTVRTSSKHYYWDAGTNTWELTYKYEYKFDKKGLRTKTIDTFYERNWDEATGKVTVTPRETTTTYKYTKDGRMSSAVHVSDGVKSTTTYKYTKKGFMKSVVRKTGKKLDYSRTYTYDKKGFTTKAVLKETMSDGTTRKETVTFKNTIKKGILRKCVEKGKNYTTTDTYDKKGRLTKSVTEEKDGTKTVYTFYTNGMVKKMTQTMGNYSSVTNYNKQGYETSETTTQPDGSIRKTTYQYKKDKSGNVLEQLAKTDGVNSWKSEFTYKKVNQ